jgi:hypothetical protein
VSPTKTTRRSPRPFAALLLLAAFAAGLWWPAARAAADERAVVRRKRVVIVRTGQLARQFPERKRAVVNLPVVSGLPPQVLRKVRAALELKNIFETSLAEYREDAWLEEFDFKVNYNKRHILDISFWQSGTGAYPDTHHAHRTISLRTGDVLKAQDVFESGALYALAGMANEKLRAEIAEQVKVVEQDKELDADGRSSIKEQLSGLSFNVEHLDNFEVGEAGVTFIYDAGFPHVIQALEPDGRYFFTYAQLAPYVRRDGPLGVFLK